jgi:proteic killer suppression protein
MLEAATQPEELNVVALHLHRLRGKPRRWSVRISAHYRITFGWSGEYAPEIDFEDYH